MYALVDPKSFWPQLPTMSNLQANQIYMTPVPVTPTYLIGGTPTQVLPMAPNQNPHATAAVVPATPATNPAPATPMYYSFHPNYSHHHHQQSYLPAITSSTRQRTSSDDVFILDNNNSQPQTQVVSLPIPPNKRNCPIRPRRRQRKAGAADEDDVMSLGSISPLKNGKRRERPRSISCTTSSDSSGSEFSPQRSDSGRSSGTSSVRSSSSPQQLQLQPANNYHHVSMDQSTSSGSHKEANSAEINDFSLFNIFSASLYSALNRDPPEPSANKDSENNVVVPLKTSSPKRKDKRGAAKVHVMSRNDDVLTMQSKTTKCASSEQSTHSMEHSDDENNIQEGRNGNRRQKFLRALEEERERQRCLVLPKQAPKMNCKFCKNNGESPDVYTKHRLHFKEKTVCPLLRMYVCRLCNSTGDFAHTIRHCPFNSRFDKVAWKATFL